MRWLWIDRIVELVPRERLVAIKNVSLAEDHLHDHFPAAPGRAAMPLMPASLMIEGMAQSAGILVGHASGFAEKVVLAKVQRAELSADATPGVAIRYTAEVAQLSSQGATTRGTVEFIDPAAGASEAVGRVDLIFSHIDRNAAGLDFGEGNFVFGDSFRTLLRMSGIE